MQHKQQHKQQLKRQCCCCGPGNKRYVIALLCSLGCTIVIGMRAEMVGIMEYLNKKVNLTAAVISSSSSSSSIFTPTAHRKMALQNAANDLIENSVFIGYIISSPIGGYLTVNYDSAMLLGCSVALTCGLNLLLPLVTQITSNVSAAIAVIVILRLMQGLAEGCLIPAVFGILRFWGPTSERASLLCSAVIGVSIGPLIGLPVCQEVEAAWGWAVVFYIYANIGLIWCIFWWRLIDERPVKDKKIDRNERLYLQSAISANIMQRQSKISIPWLQIFKSKPVYAIFITYAADDWTFQISSVCMQSYYLQMYSTDVKTTISLLLCPFLARSLFVPIGGCIADLMSLHTNLSRTTIRKTMASLGFGLKAVFFVALGFANDAIWATVLLSLALGFSGLAVAGYAVNAMDLAPNFAGLIMGLATSVSTITGITSTIIASLIVQSRDNPDRLKLEWQLALSSAGATQLIAGVAYLIFASAEPQDWAVADEDADAGGSLSSAAEVSHFAEQPDRNRENYGGDLHYLHQENHSDIQSAFGD